MIEYPDTGISYRAATGMTAQEYEEWCKEREQMRGTKPGPLSSVPPTNAELDQRLKTVEQEVIDLKRAMGLWSKP